MDKINERLDEVLEKLAISRKETSEIVKRLDKLECEAEEEPNQANFGGQAQSYSGLSFGAPMHRAPNAHDTRTHAAAASTNIEEASSATIQQDFQVVKDALQRVKLPQDLKVEDSRQGIQRKDQARFNVVQKCARFAETSVKLLSTVNAQSISEADLKDLCTIQIAQLRYLQEEHSMCLVNNNFGEGVEKIYRNFRRNTSAFPPEAIEALQAAVTLNTAQAQAPRGRGNRGPYNYRGAGRGFYSGTGRGASPYFSGNNRVQYRPNTQSENNTNRTNNDFQ